MEYENHHLDNLQSRFDFFNRRKLQDMPILERLNYGLKISLSFTVAPLLLETGLLNMDMDSLTATVMIATAGILFLYGTHTLNRFFKWRSYD